MKKTNKTPAAQIANASRYYYKNRAKILEKKKKKFEKAADKNHKNAPSDRDSAEKNAQGNEENAAESWDESRHLEQGAFNDPRLEVSPHLRSTHGAKPVKPSIISMLSPKPVSLFRVGKNSGITGGLSDAKLPDN